MLTKSHRLQVALNKGMEGRLIQLDFSRAFNRVSRRSLLYKLRSIGVGRQFLSIVSDFISDRKQCVRLDGKVSASVDVVRECPRVAFKAVVIVYLKALPHC